MIRATSLGPYVGLQPFREEDYPYFFGRERDVRVISSNLMTQPLTVLYGSSGVGKSSALRAGVMPHLRAASDAVPVYYNAWQSESFLEELTATCRTALGVTDPKARLSALMGSAGKKLFLLLDQFEELLLYHPTGPAAEEFDSVLAHLVNRDDVTANVLIGIREDALSGFDHRYGIRIADLLGNTLPLDHLSNDAARRAILEPLRVFNERHPVGPRAYSIEPELTEEILRQVQPNQFAVADDDGRATRGLGTGPGKVETPFLQLVLRRLWDEEVRSSSQTLRLDTLRRIGGARQIVEKHVNEVLASLPSDADRDIAAWMFKYLVTPGRSKIAQTTDDLIAYTEASAERVRQVLSLLADKPESRILRRLDTPERYEIFHDVLAQPVLDWRKKYVGEQERLEQLREADRIRREVLRLRWLVGAMVVLLIAAAGFAWYALDQRGRVALATQQLQIAHQQGDAAENDARSLRERQIATEATLRASQAEIAGQAALAARLKADAAEANKQADALKNSAQAERDKAAQYLDGKDKNYRDAVQQIADLRRERDQLQAQVKQLTQRAADVRAEGSTNQEKKPTGPVNVRGQASIGGLVTDTTGFGLPGVEVEAASPALIEKARTAVTDGKGQYRFVDLRPGTYAMSFSLPGFTTVKRSGIELAATFTATVNAELSVSAAPRKR